MKEPNFDAEILEREDINELHSIVCQALNLEHEKTTDSVIKEFWNKLPLHLKYEAFEWGCSDTLVREKMYTWWRRNNE